VQREYDKGIGMTVEWLQAHGFETTDSGDGVSKPEAGEVGEGGVVEVQAFPHVVAVVPPEALAGEADRLACMLAERGIALQPQGRAIEVEPNGTPADLHQGPTLLASYDPADGSAVLFLANVDDALLFGSEVLLPLGDIKAGRR